jgi:hypothetical protein
MAGVNEDLISSEEGIQVEGGSSAAEHGCWKCGLEAIKVQTD